MKKIYDNYFIDIDGNVYNKHNKILKPVDNGKGYLRVNLTLLDGTIICKAIHRLIAEAYIENPDNLPEVNHKDCNRKNNSIDNLEWCTHAYNIEYSYECSNRSAKGTSNANCKTNEDTVHSICEHLQSGLKPSKIRDLGFDYALIRTIKAKRNWKEISRNYNF